MGSLTPSTTTTTSTFASNITNSSNSTSTSPQTPLQLLEITLISAQDLAPVSKSMRTYAVVWVQPDRKLTTKVDHRGHSNPTWNDKFVFRIKDEEFLNSDSSAVMVEIYTVSWFRDNLVGNVKVLLNNLIPPFARRPHNNLTTRFVALQVRRASGSPQGILNMGVSLIDSSMRSMPIHIEPSGSVINGSSDFLTDNKMHEENEQEENQRGVNAKIQLWRSLSEKSEQLNFEEEEFLFPPKGGGSVCDGGLIVNGGGSICNGSIVNESELCSDVGPSASVVAAAIAKGLYPIADKKGLVSTVELEDRGSSILEDLTVEEATAKGYRSKAERWHTELPAAADQSFNKADSKRHSRRHSDAGLFSCFAYGFEFTIVCGTKNNSRNKNINSEKPVKHSPSSYQNLSI